MKSILFISAFALLTSFCYGRAVTEESVVSVYTNSNSSGQLDVYGQIATNIAEKITSPFYRFFGINNTEQTTKRPFEHIELQENITRDVEELSEDALKRTEKKPEKITLFSNYLPSNEPERVNLLSYLPIPVLGKLELNETNLTNEIAGDDDDFDDEFSLDDVEVNEPRGPFVYILELIGSVIQLLWGGFLAIFKPSNTDE